MVAHTDLSVIIQAGGGSTRMGKNKALMPFLGQPLISRVLQRVQPLAAEILVTTNDPADFTFLKVPLIPDDFPGLGALGGLYTALQAAAHPLAAVIACDMPFVNVRLLAVQRQILMDEHADAVLPVLAHGFEPFHAVYRVATCLPAVRSAIHAGKRRAIAWMGDVKVRELTEPEIRAFDPHLLAFLNVNTPEEFKRAEAIAASKED